MEPSGLLRAPPQQGKRGIVSRRHSLDGLPTSMDTAVSGSSLESSGIPKYKPFDDYVDPTKEYQSLFWMPMIIQTSNEAEDIIEETLSMISSFHDSIAESYRHKCSFILPPEGYTRQKLILGDIEDNIDKNVIVDYVPKSESTKYTILSVFKKHFLFSSMQDYELEDMICAMSVKYVEEGEVIIKEGDPGDLFYVLEEGSVTISIKGETVGELSSSASFGDLAIMYNSPRAATITGSSDCTLWCLDRFFFRKAMVISASNQNTHLTKFLSKIPLFKDVSVSALNQLGRSLEKKEYRQGDYIIKQGDVAEHFYVIGKGKVKVTKTTDDHHEDGTKVEIFLLSLGEGDVFGERALINKEPRAANVIADSDVVEVYFLNRDDFTLILGEIVEKLLAMNEFRVLRPLAIFQDFSDNQLNNLLKVIQKETFYRNQRFNCDDKRLYIIWSGKLESINGKVYNSGCVIGDLDNSADIVAGTVRILSPEAIVGTLLYEKLYECISTHETASLTDIKVESRLHTRHLSVSLEGANVSQNPLAQRTIIEGIYRRQTAVKTRLRSIDDTNRITSLAQLEVLAKICTGTFGTVYRAFRTTDGKIFALKSLDKGFITSNGYFQYVKREAVALQIFQHTFICEYYGIFLTPCKVVFVLEHIPGPDLWMILYQPEYQSVLTGIHGGFLVRDAAIYLSAVIQALEHIHNYGYCYRDIKPDNLVVDSQGHVKLVDFGLAKPIPFVNKNNQVQYRTFTLCGTEEYLAPEVVLTQGHDKSADFWSLGILLYELICREAPFKGRNQQRTFEKIVHSQKFLHFPNGFNVHAKSLIRRLLNKNAGLRLGALQQGFDDFKRHIFFLDQKVDFLAVAARSSESTPSYVPSFDDSDLFGNTSDDSIRQLDFHMEPKAVTGDDENEVLFHSLTTNIADVDMHEIMTLEQ